MRPPRITDPELRLIWKHTHLDAKGVTPEGVRTLLVYRAEHGTCLVPLDGLTPSERSDRLELAKARENRELARKGELE